MAGTLPQTPLSLAARIFLHYIAPVLESIYGRPLNQLDDTKTRELFHSSAEIEQVFGPQDQVLRMSSVLVKAINEAPYSALGRYCSKQEMERRSAASGTTLLQRLLACDPKARGIKLYEIAPGLASNVVPPANEDNWETHPKIAKATETIQELGTLFPTYLDTFRASHYVSVNEYEEETAIGFHQQFDFMGIVNNPDVLALQENQEYRVQVYVYMKRFFQMLMAGFPNREHLLLKAPIHCDALQALMSVFPDARVVCMKRDPVKVIPSCALMISRFEAYRIADGVIDAKEYGQDILERMVKMTESMKTFREQVKAGQVKLIPNVAVDAELKNHVVNPEQFLDVEYGDLVQDPIATVHSIYKHYGMTVTKEFEEAMKLYLLENPQGKHVKGKEVDAKAMFGFTDEGIRSAFEGL
ncbi:hypothetical protein HDU79_005883 [Rhizoclosmatium sp. JEL0117]|nr:hypothetical protein HDU79_005883 [Rhizoclosmatium sp. JEL0117]